MDLFVKRITNLLCVKSIVTLTLTAVFAYMAVLGRVSADQFLAIFTMIVGFYFGVQSEKKSAQAEQTVQKETTE